MKNGISKLLLLGCSGGTTAVAAVWSFSLACDQGGTVTPATAGHHDASAGSDVTVVPDVDAGGPVISNVQITPNPNNVLSATVTYTTDRPALGSAQIVNDGAPTNSITPPPETVASTSHSFFILGMRATSSFTVTIVAKDAAGHASLVKTSLQTPALPPDVPVPTIVLNDKTKTAPGFLMINAQEWTGAPAINGPLGSYVIGLDQDLQIVWYGADALVDPERLPDGTFAGLMDQGKKWLTYDMMGNVLSSTVATKDHEPAFTHALTPEADGFLTLSPDMRMLSGFVLPGNDGSVPVPIVGASIEVLGYDGSVKQIADTYNFWDPHTTEGNLTMFETGFWDSIFPAAGHTYDWIHANAIYPDLDGNIIVSSRTQSWIFKVERATGKLLWRLGAGGDFTLTNPGETWQYGQHGAIVTPTGTIMCFDDGNNRPLPPGTEPFSRAVEYALDTQKMTATIVWQFQDNMLSAIYGSTYVLKNNNVLIDDGCHLAGDTGAFDPMNLKTSRIIEVTHDMPPVKVMEVDLGMPLGTFPPDPQYSGFATYRAYKWQSLYTADPFDH